MKSDDLMSHPIDFCTDKKPPRGQMKTVVITGASGGIGAAATTYFAAQGWRVIACGFPELPASGANVVPLLCDITQDASVAGLVARCGGEVHGLVNNAGIHLPAPLEGLPLDQLRQQFEVNVIGHLRVTQALLPLLRAAQGRIINVSSLMGEVALPLMGAYSMSKHALEAMSDALRLELDVPVSVVQMGAVQTPMTTAMGALLDVAYARMPHLLQARYALLQQQMKQALARQGSRAIPPQQVVHTIERALTDRQPQARYRVDTATRGLSLMRRLSPERVGDAILRWSLGIK